MGNGLGDEAQLALQAAALYEVTSPDKRNKDK